MIFACYRQLDNAIWPLNPVMGLLGRLPTVPCPSFSYDPRINSAYSSLQPPCMNFCYFAFTPGHKARSPCYHGDGGATSCFLHRRFSATGKIQVPHSLPSLRYHKTRWSFGSTSWTSGAWRILCRRVQSCRQRRRRVLESLNNHWKSINWPHL